MNILNLLFNRKAVKVTHAASRKTRRVFVPKRAKIYGYSQMRSDVQKQVRKGKYYASR